MPRGDGTGPLGMGMMSGRGAGFCAGKYAPDTVMPETAFRFGCKRGRGFRRMYYATGLPGLARYNDSAFVGEPSSASAERDWLKNRVQFLEMQLQEINKQLAKLDEEKK